MHVDESVCVNVLRMGQCVAVLPMRLGEWKGGSPRRVCSRVHLYSYTYILIHAKLGKLVLFCMFWVQGSCAVIFPVR